MCLTVWRSASGKVSWVKSGNDTSSFSVTWSYYTKNHVYNYWFHIRIQIWENRTSSCVPRFEIMKFSFSLPSLVSLPFSASLSPFSPLSPQPLPVTLSPFLSLSEVSVYIVQAGIEFMNSWLLSWFSLLDGIANTHHFAPGPSSSLLIPHWYDYFRMFKLAEKKWKSQREALS